MSDKTAKLTVSAVLIALATALSEIKLPGIWVHGGGITIVSMLPLVLLTNRYGTRYGLVCCLGYSLIQMILGIDNLQWAQSFLMGVGIVLFDYVLAYTAIGTSAVFKGKLGGRRKEIALGVVLSMTLRFICHFISGWMVWHSIAPEQFSWSTPLWSLIYNVSYMAPEIILTTVGAVVSYDALKKQWENL